MNSSGSNTVSPKTWHPARFAIEGKVLTFCLSLDPKVRPTEFTSNPNSLRRLYILERVDGWKFGYHRKAIHVAAKEPRPDDGFKDDPNKRLAIDAPSQSAPAPGYDLSPGMQIAHSFRFRDGVALPRLSANGNVIVCLVDKTVQCLDPLTRRVISQITPPGAAWVSPDGTQVAVFTDKPLSIRMCEVATGKTLKTIELLSNPWVPIIFSPGGRYLIGVNRGVDLRIWDTVEGRQVRRIDVPIFSVDISSDGRFLVGSDDKKVYLYDFASLRLEREFPFGANSAIFSPDGKLIYAAAGPRIMTLDRATGARLADYSPDRPMDGGLWVSRDHKHLIGITQVQHGAAVFQVGSPKLMAGFYLPLNASIAHPGRAVFEQNGNEVLLLCSKFDPALKGTAAPAPDDVSKLPAFKITERFKVAVPGLPMPYFGVTAFSPNGKYVLTSTRDKQVKIYDTAVGKLVKTITTNFDQVTGLAMSSDDYIYIGGGIGRLVPGGFNQSPTYIAKYHLSTSKEDRILGLVGAFKGLKLSPDGTRLYGIGIDFSLRVWDVKTRAQLHAWEKLFRVPKSLEISPDGKTGLMVMDSGPVVLNLENFRDVLKLPEGTHEMCMIGDGSKAAMISKNITLKIWDLKTGNVYRSVDLVDRDSPKSFGVERSSKDGKLLYITGQLGGEDFYHIYDIDAGKFVYRYQLPGERNQRFTAPDGAAVVVRSLDALRGLELPPLPKR
jgi:WD40 repeat protein